VILLNRGRVVALGPREQVWPRCVQLLKAGAVGIRCKQEKPSRRSSPQPSRPILELMDVTIRGAGRLLLRKVTWTVRTGEHWVLFGHNGAGKTTLLSLIQGDHPQVYSQQVRLFGKPLGSTQTLWRLRQSIGSMSPELLLHYPPGWSCLQVVCSGFFQSVGLHQACSRSQSASARAWLVRLGLGRFFHEPIGALPLGLQRLVLLARAAVRKPRLLILDEPCLGLDPGQRKRFLETVDQIVHRTGATLLLVSHHHAELPSCITHSLELRRGRISHIRARAQASKSPSCLRNSIQVS
jgi:molybdate transport system ATP-binding protein